jgi:flagellar protein FliS
MDQRLRNFYLESTVNSASPGQLLVMLYDSLIQQAEAAEMELASPENPHDRSKAAMAVSHCIDIITQLSASLKHEFDPTLCGTLSNLYCFFTRELSAALERSESEKVRRILPLLRELRSSWSQALKITEQSRPVATT